MPTNSADKLWSIVPAAGLGRRMAATVPKQYLEINGKTVLETTIGLLTACEDIDRVIVPIAAEDRWWPTLACAVDAKVNHVLGGRTRAQSVYNGLLQLKPNAKDQDWVLVHDAARPCLSGNLLARFIQQLKSDPVGGILALPAKDTLKRSHMQHNAETNTVEHTLDRDFIWLAQTPQMFRFSLLFDAIEQGLHSNAAVTDEASAMEMAGHKPRLIKGDARNIKLTTPDDLALIEFLLS